MKFAHLLFAASLLTFTAASAQTTPLPNGPGTAPSAPGTTTASPSTVPSGTAPVQADPKGAVSAGEVFTKGSPTSATADERRMKRQQAKAMKQSGKTKMKAKM